MILKLRDSESNQHPMHRLSASEYSGVFNRLPIKAVLPSSIRESKTEAHQKRPVNLRLREVNAKSEN